MDPGTFLSALAHQGAPLGEGRFGVQFPKLKCGKVQLGRGGIRATSEGTIRNGCQTLVSTKPHRAASTLDPDSCPGKSTTHLALNLVILPLIFNHASTFRRLIKHLPP